MRTRKSSPCDLVDQQLPLMCLHCSSRRDRYMQTFNPFWLMLQNELLSVFFTPASVRLPKEGLLITRFWSLNRRGVQNTTKGSPAPQPSFSAEPVSCFYFFNELLTRAAQRLPCAQQWWGSTWNLSPGSSHHSPHTGSSGQTPRQDEWVTVFTQWCHSGQAPVPMGWIYTTRWQLLHQQEQEQLNPTISGALSWPKCKSTPTVDFFFPLLNGSGQ